jgi:hypothetical protein
VLVINENYIYWLKSLDVGDEVSHTAGKFGLDRIVKTTVKSITPTGKIRTNSGYLFDNETGTAYNNRFLGYGLLKLNPSV